MQLYGCYWIQGVTNCRRCLRDSSAAQCWLPFLICVSSHSFNIINNKVNKIAESWPIRHIFLKADAFERPNSFLNAVNNLFFEVAEIISVK